jgi:hypothetical protein
MAEIVRHRSETWLKQRIANFGLNVREELANFPSTV